MNESIADRLVCNGMSAEQAKRKAELFFAAEGAFATTRASLGWFVPGRIEVLGKHTDYAGGRSLLCTAERGICVVASERTDSKVRITDASRMLSTEFELSPDLQMAPYGWIVYPQTVARRVARNFHGSLKGADIALGSDLPAAAGMSSSSALVTAIFTALTAVNDLEARDEYKAAIRSPEDLAAYLGCIENGQSFRSLAGDLGVGTFGGSEDHTAIQCCRPGSLSQFSFCPIHSEGTVDLPDTHTYAIASSGISAQKTGSAREKYNRVSLAAQAVLEICREKLDSELPSLEAAARQNSADKVREAIRLSTRQDFSAQELLARFDQFYTESEEIIPKSVAALRQRRWGEFGSLVDRSQRGAEEGLCNQVPETIALARIARTLGADAASAFGAGFGGGVWALIAKAEAEHFTSQWQSEYAKQFPSLARRGEFFCTAAGPPLHRVF